MRKQVVLITGAAGEIGQALISKLSQQDIELLTLDLRALPEHLRELTTHIRGDILDDKLFGRLVTEYDIEAIIHLAALLSTRSEFAPELAHQVNVNGTLALLKVAADQSQRREKPVRFLFPSSIAVYGLPDLTTKSRDAKVHEWDWNYPTTMYGCNKLYCEMLGAYYSGHYQQLADKRPVKIDFRGLRFPGLISAFTLPTGGTTDYGPEMIHAAARGEAYASFVRPDTVLPFMVMPDAIEAVLKLTGAAPKALSRSVYNITSFSLSAAEFRQRVHKAFPEAETTFDVDERRQAIVDSWPADLDDGAARRDWGWAPDYDIDQAFEEYLIPNISQRYRRESAQSA